MYESSPISVLWTPYYIRLKVKACYAVSCSLHALEWNILITVHIILLCLWTAHDLLVTRWLHLWTLIDHIYLSSSNLWSPGHQTGFCGHLILRLLLGWRVGSVVRALDWRFYPKVEGLNPVRSTRKTELFWVKQVVLTHCRCAQPSCVYMHSYERPCTHVKDPVVHVRVWWITETRK